MVIMCSSGRLESVKASLEDLEVVLVTEGNSTVPAFLLVEFDRKSKKYLNRILSVDGVVKAYWAPKVQCLNASA